MSFEISLKKDSLQRFKVRREFDGASRRKDGNSYEAANRSDERRGQACIVAYTNGLTIIMHLYRPDPHGTGDVVFVPRGTPHGFICTGPEVGRQIIISSPGGIFDAMIAEVTMLDTGSPTRKASDEAKAIATKYGLEFLPS